VITLTKTEVGILQPNMYKLQRSRKRTLNVWSLHLFGPC